MKINALFIAIFLTLFLSACSSVTIKPEGGKKITAAASYSERKDFFFWGLKGEHRIDVNEACDGAKVLQMQTVTTSNDYILGLLTLFIYAPSTAKIWCEA